MRNRGWHLADLTGADRDIAERLIFALLNTAPGSHEEREAFAKFRRFDRAICERDGWKRWA